MCWYGDDLSCTNFGGTPVVDGWCDADGTCTTGAPEALYACCDDLNTEPYFGCAGGPMAVGHCAVDPGATLVEDAVCTPTGCEAP